MPAIWYPNLIVANFELKRYERIVLFADNRCLPMAVIKKREKKYIQNDMHREIEWFKIRFVWPLAEYKWIFFTHILYLVLYFFKFKVITISSSRCIVCNHPSNIINVSMQFVRIPNTKQNREMGRRQFIWLICAHVFNIQSVLRTAAKCKWQ